MALIDIIAADAAAVLRNGDARMAAELLRFFHERFCGFANGEHAPYPDECTGVKINKNGFTISFAAKHLHYADDGRGPRWLVSESEHCRMDKASGHDKAVHRFSAPYAFLEGIQYAVECYRNSLKPGKVLFVEETEAKRRAAVELLLATLDRIHELQSEVRDLEESVKQPALIDSCREKAAFALGDVPELAPAPASTMSIRAARASLKGDSGVYFLWDGDEIAYVGRADCISRRLGSHHKMRPHHRVSAVPMSIPESWRHETYYIWKYDPPLNGHSKERAGAVE